MLANSFIKVEGFIDILNNSISAYNLVLSGEVYVAKPVTEIKNQENVIVETLDRNLVGDTIVVQKIVNDKTVEENITEIEYLENGIKTILGSNTDETAGLKYTFIPLEPIDDEEKDVFNVLRYFINLENISFIGTSKDYLFATSKTANEVFEIVANVTTRVTRITFNYTGLSDISPIDSMVELEHIDLRFNYTRDNYIGIKDINPILTLQEQKVALSKKNISYISVYKTDLNILYGEVVFAKIYSINNETKIFYELEGVEALYNPGDLNSYQLRAINSCAVLHEIGKIDSPYIILPTHVYLDSTGSPVSWRLDVANSLATLTNNKLTINTLGLTGEIVLSATVSFEVDETINGETVVVVYSYTRYFYIEVL